MKLSDLIRREKNNADALRLVAAAAVIWGHAYALAPEPGRVDPIQTLLTFDYSGSLAVKFFFFLSGLLVTNSLVERPSAVAFACARFFRIIPALVVCAAIVTLLAGPFFTTVSLPEYIRKTQFVHIIFVHPFLDYQLVGVFKDHAFPQMNGSIWTIQYEIFLYTFLLAIGLLGLLRSKLIGSIICLVAIALALIDPSIISYIGLGAGSSGRYFPAFFAGGALLAIHKETIEISYKFVIGLVLLAASVRLGTAFELFFLVAFLIGTLALSSTSLIKAIKLPGDYSYGVYVYGWPVQQCVREIWPNIGIHGNQALTITLAGLLAIFSWHCVERPSLNFGKRLALWLPAAVMRPWRASGQTMFVFRRSGGSSDLALCAITNRVDYSVSTKGLPGSNQV
jgi:peptidoglycan/LPS O-acetylase OafA/YrhL